MYGLVDYEIVQQVSHLMAEDPTAPTQSGRLTHLVAQGLARLQAKTSQIQEECAELDFTPPTIEPECA